MISGKTCSLEKPQRTAWQWQCDGHRFVVSEICAGSAVAASSQLLPAGPEQTELGEPRWKLAWWGTEKIEGRGRLVCCEVNADMRDCGRRTGTQGSEGKRNVDREESRGVSN